MAAGAGIAGWPPGERPRERLYHQGAAALADAELLAIQLGSGIRGRSAVELAREMLARYGSLSGLARREIAELAALRGVGQAKAIRLAAAFELTRRLRSRHGEQRVVLSDPRAVFARYGPMLEDLHKEVFRVALLDAQNGLLRDVVVSEGTLSASLVHPREVFKPAILESAASVILVHNHPSGDPTPSREDVRLTRQLAECARLFDIRLHDHVVVGRGRFVSLAEEGELREDGGAPRPRRASEPGVSGRGVCRRGVPGPGISPNRSGISGPGASGPPVCGRGVLDPSASGPGFSESGFAGPGVSQSGVSEAGISTPVEDLRAEPVFPRAPERKPERRPPA